MAVISLTITASADQVVSGIPKSITITSNIASTIFYTIDGSTPTLASSIYTGPISLQTLPSVGTSLILQVFATNGTDSSPVIEQIYEPSILNNNMRTPRADTNQQPNSIVGGNSKFPFGSDYNQSNVLYTGSPGSTGTTVDNPLLPQVSNGFDGANNPNNFSNSNLDTTNYNIVYTTTDSTGEMSKGAGNMPGNVKINYPAAQPEETSTSDRYFNPRSFVVFQNYSTSPTDVPIINKLSYTNIDVQTNRDGAFLRNVGLDVQSSSGSFLKNYYNPITKEMTYYYFDRTNLSWIISKQPHDPDTFGGSNLGNLVGGRNPADGFVYKWVPWSRRMLF